MVSSKLRRVKLKSQWNSRQWQVFIDLGLLAPEPVEWKTALSVGRSLQEIE